MENTYTPLKSYLESSGQQFSQDNLKSLATSKGIANYTGTDVQNKQLAGLLTPTTPLATTPPPTTNVNANSLIQTNPISLPNTPVTTVPTVPISAADRILNQINLNEQTNAQKAQENIIGKKLEALAGLTGESAALVAEQEKAGVNRLKTELQNINTQILTKQAEIQQDDISLISKMRAEERRDTLLPFAQIGQAKLQGDAAIYRALKQSEIGVLNATAIAKQGDIQLAKETAQEAVDIKYAPYKEQIKQYDAVLEAIAPLLSRDEKIQATKQQIRGQVAMKEIDREAANEKQLNDMLIQASSQNAPASLLSKAKLAKTPTEAAMILGQYAGDYYKTELLKNQIATEKAQRAKYYSDIENSKKELAAKLGITPTAASGKIEASQSTYNLANELLTLPGKSGAVGAGVGKFFGAVIPGYDGTAFAGSDRANYEAKVAQLKDTLASANLDKLKGAMSDKDIEFLRNIGTALKLEMSEDAFDAELEKIKKTMTKVPGVVPVTPVVNNPFAQAIGQTGQTIPGASIINNVTPTGDINFKLPQ